MTTTRSTTAIAADLATYRTARTALVKGERVRDVWRDGRRLVFSEITLAQIDAAITSLENEYEQAANVEAGRPRRRPIGLAWRG